jgi:hypothetical protein
MTNLYIRLVAYVSTFIAGLLPAWALGWIVLDPNGEILRFDVKALTLALTIAVVASVPIFQKWGVKPDVLVTGALSGSYFRVMTYAGSFLLGLLPANVAGSIHFDALNWVLSIDLPAFGAAWASALGISLGISKVWGLAPPKA